MASDILRLLLGASVACAAVILLLLLVRPLLQRAFGTQVAYLAWAAVPAALLAGLLPAAPAAAPVLYIVAPVQQQLASASEPLRHASGSEWPALLAAAWLAGCAAMLVRMWQEHRRFRALGDAAGPAVVGLWQPAVIVPRDFRVRYTAAERRLIVAHENVHVRRRDPLANCLCALVQCLLWFHPLVHVGARRFRLDQELSCDAAVMQKHPGLRRSYAEAMLKTQLSSQGALIHCHWQSIHPLKERIMQLQHISPRPLRQSAGRAVVAAIIALCGAGAMAAQGGAGKPVEAQQYMINMQLATAGEQSSPRLRVSEGEPFAVATTAANGTWHSDMVLEKTAGQSLKLSAVVKHNERVVGKPSVLLRQGEPATIEVRGDGDADTFKMTLAVAPAAKAPVKAAN